MMVVPAPGATDRLSPALLGQAGPRGCSSRELKLWECAWKPQSLPVRQDPRSRRRAGVSQGLPCPAPALGLAGIWDAPGTEGAGTAIPCGAFPRHCQRHCRSGSPSRSPPSLPWGSLMGFFICLMFVPHSVGKSRQSPEGTGCRQSSCSVLTLPGPRRDRDPLTGQESPAGWERRAKQSCLPLFQVLP